MHQRKKRTTPLFLEEQQRGRVYTAQEDAIWIKSHVACMSFEIVETAQELCKITFREIAGYTPETIWGSPEMWNQARLCYILTDLYGAYMTVPLMTSYFFPDGGFGFVQSCLFFNFTLIEHARRTFPLPQGLLPGIPRFRFGQLGKEALDTLRKQFDVSPHDLYLSPMPDASRSE